MDKLIWYKPLQKLPKEGDRIVFFDKNSNIREMKFVWDDIINNVEEDPLKSMQSWLIRNCMKWCYHKDLLEYAKH